MPPSESGNDTITEDFEVLLFFFVDLESAFFKESIFNLYKLGFLIDLLLVLMLLIFEYFKEVHIPVCVKYRLKINIAKKESKCFFMLNICLFSKKTQLYNL